MQLINSDADRKKIVTVEAAPTCYKAGVKERKYSVSGQALRRRRPQQMC